MNVRGTHDLDRTENEHDPEGEGLLPRHGGQSSPNSQLVPEDYFVAILTSKTVLDIPNQWVLFATISVSEVTAIETWIVDTSAAKYLADAQQVKLGRLKDMTPTLSFLHATTKQIAAENVSWVTLAVGDAKLKYPTGSTFAGNYSFGGKTGSLALNFQLNGDGSIFQTVWFNPQTTGANVDLATDKVIAMSPVSGEYGSVCARADSPLRASP